MAKNITILSDIKKVGELTPLEKKIASEITRFTLQRRWFYKSFDTFAVELDCSVSGIKNTYSKLRKLEWLETEKSDSDKRFYKYRMTQKFFNFISNILEKKDENWAVYQVPNKYQNSTELVPNKYRISTDFEDSTPLKPNEINTQTTVDNSPKVLNNEGMKVLRVEEKGEKNKLEELTEICLDFNGVYFSVISKNLNEEQIKILALKVFTDDPNLEVNKMLNKMINWSAREGNVVKSQFTIFPKAPEPYLNPWEKEGWKTNSEWMLYGGDFTPEVFYSKTEDEINFFYDNRNKNLKQK